MRTRNFIMFTLALATSVTFALLARGEEAPAAAAAAGAADGKALFTAQKCNMCHSVPTAEIKHTTTSAKMAGPDLMVDGMDKDLVMKFLKKEAKDANGKMHGKAFTGTPEELGTLTDWLLANKKPA